ncbi:glycosyltransferase [Streptomyces sp. NBC_01142]|uniref:glycosyltransferase n=1 Tax=Streptomyces sp. NBC_01142 TaxID=2975865 RepID=UPI00225B244B|nr:glycosyltransferase [Streptomyces sp. NBC_01142]MCX4823048.1 glycosyltransferase [Streptomyces sp. NBC_01142]
MNTLRVSIVVPVYNAGPYLERCAPSLIGQTLDPGEFEIIYVDDGSTDGSAERLDRLAAEHPNVRVHHQENSGWPGKPRNVGIEMARGEYIQLVDQDDELAPEALERLYGLAQRNGSDIVLGKMAGTMVGPSNVFKRTIESCTVADAPLIETLTAHRLFRRDFLREHDIRFPEGYWRMEDLLFMARAYPLAKTVSVLADYPCYFWNRREDGGNNSTAAFDLAGHYDRLRLIIGALRDATDPGALQDHLLRRLYRVETLSRVGDPFIVDAGEEERQEAYELVRAVALECFPPGVREGMPAVQKLRATLLEDGRPDGLLELGRRLPDVRPHLDIADLGWREDGTLSMKVRLTLHREGVGPLALVEQGESLVLDPEFTDGIPGAAALPVADPLSYAYGELIVHDRDRNLWWFPEGELVPRLESLGEGRSQVVVEGVAVIDPLTLAGGQPLLPGSYDIWLGGQVLGVGRRPRLNPADSQQRTPVGATELGGTGRTVTATWSGPGKQLRLVVRNPAPAPSPRPAPSPVPVVAPPTGARRLYRAGLRTLPKGPRRTVRRLAASVLRRLRG